MFLKSRLIELYAKFPELKNWGITQDEFSKRLENVTVNDDDTCSKCGQLLDGCYGGCLACDMDDDDDEKSQSE